VERRGLVGRVLCCSAETTSRQRHEGVSSPLGSAERSSQRMEADFFSDGRLAGSEAIAASNAGIQEAWATPGRTAAGRTPGQDDSRRQRRIPDRYQNVVSGGDARSWQEGAGVHPRILRRLQGEALRPRRASRGLLTISRDNHGMHRRGERVKRGAPGAHEARGASCSASARDSTRRMASTTTRLGLGLPVLSDADGQGMESYRAVGRQGHVPARDEGINRSTVLIGIGRKGPTARPKAA